MISLVEPVMKTGKPPCRFSREEAVRKLGHDVRLIACFSDMPEGTTGRVMEIDEIDQGGFDLIVEWKRRVSGKLQHDWFSKEEFERYLVEA